MRSWGANEKTKQVKINGNKYINHLKCIYLKSDFLFTCFVFKKTYRVATNTEIIVLTSLVIIVKALKGQLTRSKLKLYEL